MTAESGQRIPKDGPATPHLRILAISHTGLRSGAEIVLQRLILHAAQKGCSVVLAAPSGPMTAGLAEAGVSLVGLPELKLPAGPRAVAAFRLAGRSLRAGRILRRAGRDANVVVVNGLLALPAVRLARIRRPVAWIVHDHLHTREERVLLRACADAVTLAIPVSEAVAVPVRAADIRTRVVHNGTPWPVEPAPLERAEPAVIGCNALLTPWKGLHVLLDAVAALPRTDVVVELLGATFPKDGPYVDALHERAARADLAGRVRFLGHVADPLAVMRSWSVAVSASVEPEACPLAVLEAMSLGLPVVGTDHGGTPEVLHDPERRVAPGDPAAMAAAIERLLDDVALCRRLSSANRARVANHFQLDGQLAVVLGVLHELAGPAHRLPPPPPARMSPWARIAGVGDGAQLLLGRRLRTAGAVVLAYHDVAEDPDSTVDYCVSPAQLRSQLEAAQAWGVRFVDLADLTDAFLGGDDLDGLGAIVFDDGLVGVHRHALPVLADLGLPATVFAVTDGLGSPPPWWPGAAQIMTRAQLAEVSATGVRLAAHSRTHPSLPTLDDHDLAREVVDSARLLEDISQSPVNLFAYPFGDHDRRSRQAVADAGYRAAFTFLNGRVTPGLDRMRLPRMTMGPHHSRLRLAVHLARTPGTWPQTQVERWPQA